MVIHNVLDFLPSIVAYREENKILPCPPEVFNPAGKIKYAYIWHIICKMLHECYKKEQEELNRAKYFCLSKADNIH